MHLDHIPRSGTQSAHPRGEFTQGYRERVRDSVSDPVEDSLQEIFVGEHQVTEDFRAAGAQRLSVLGNAVAACAGLRRELLEQPGITLQLLDTQLGGECRGGRLGGTLVQTVQLGDIRRDDEDVGTVRLTLVDGQRRRGDAVVAVAPRPFHDFAPRGAW